MGSFLILIPTLAVLAISFAAHFSASNYPQGFFRSVVASFLPCIPLGFVAGIWLRGQLGWELFFATFAGAAGAVIIDLVVSAGMGVLFLADYRRLQEGDADRQAAGVNREP